MSRHDKTPYILPDEVTPRIYGRITLVIASALLVGNLYVLAMYAASPLFKPLGLRMEIWSNRLTEDMFAKHREGLKKKEAAAKTPQEKAEAAADLARFDQRPKPLVNSFSMGFAASEPLVVKAYGALDGAVGLFLNVAMLIGGIGLVALRRWGLRTLLWVAASKLAMIAIFAVVMMGWILPVQLREMKAQLAGTFAPGRPGAPVPTMTPEIFAAMVTSFVVVYVLLAAVFPLLLLIQLRKPRVKAACLAAETPGSDLAS